MYAARAAAAGPHLGERTPVGRRHHACRGGSDRRVGVEHAERQRLEHHGLGEGALDLQHGGVREEHLALAVGADVPGEPVVRQPACRALVDDAPVAQEADLRVPEPELGQLREEASEARRDAVAAPVGQSPGEHLEDAAAVGGAVLQRGVDHGEFVLVGQECGGHVSDPNQDRAHRPGSCPGTVDNVGAGAICGREARATSRGRRASVRWSP